jgi:Tfp pilus assembly protein PilW
VDQTVIDRYAGPPAWRRPVTIAVVALIALAGLTWLAWAAYQESTPEVTSQLVTFTVEGEHAVRAEVAVRLASGATGASCTVEAVAEDHSVVGELHFTPTDGTNRVTVRTERQATSVDVPGCIAKGQDRPR